MHCLFLSGMLAFLAACVLMLVVAVIVWRPHDAGIYPMKHWKPKYRNLGAPPPVPSYIRYDEDHWPSGLVAFMMAENIHLEL